MNRDVAIELFYRALLRVPGWETMQVSAAAQAVQRSAFPGAYQRWEAPAATLAATLGGQDCGVAGAWALPVRGQYRLTARFGAAGSRWANRHTGLDFAAVAGTPVIAAADGVVISAESDGAYGLSTVVEHSPRLRTRYAHQSGVLISPGTPVRVGQQIGLVGATGNVTGPHLHFEVLTGPQSVPVDPYTFLRARGLQP
jgi:murein DD-endopeptidase MepM/ murein hydrolase activator NlpD